MEMFQPANTVFQPDPVMDYIYIPNTEYTHPRHGHTVHVNIAGFFGPDYGKKTDSVFRIAIVGDSWVSGILRTPQYTSPCIEFQHLLDRRQIRAEVINCGIDGVKRGYAGYKSIEYKVMDFEPDIVLLGFEVPFRTQNRAREHYRNFRMAYAVEDSLGRQQCVDVIDSYYRKEKLINILTKSNIVKLFCKLDRKYRFCTGRLSLYIALYTTHQTGTMSRDDIYFSVGETVDMVKELRDRLGEKGTKFFFFCNSPDSRAFAIARENRLPLFYLNLDFEPDVDLFRHDNHPSPVGNQKIATRMLEIMENNKLIPEKYYPNPNL